MSGRIPQHFIDELIARADLIEIIGSRIPLKKAGKEYKACCPFHGEKTPSFTVVPDKQFYHCFGCGAHGTALGFLMEHDHLSFVEAVEDLAERVGLEVPRDQTAQEKPKPADDLFSLLSAVAEFYGRELHNHPNAQAYVRKRGLTPETVTRFGIGFAPDRWDSVLTTFGSNEHRRQQLHQVGLVIERDRKEGGGERSGYYDRFRDRLMFPIRDTRGRVIGFGGRVLEQGEPKYLNSPETELFHKGRELYGLHEARQATRQLRRLLVVEGYMDVVRLHQAGITYAVATLGTATTPEHLTRIFRVCSEVVFCFDGDRAGRGAAWRALENALPQIREGREIRFLFLPEGHDPDSLVGEEGREAFEKRLGTALPLSEYLIQRLSEDSDMHSVDGRAKFAEQARPLLGKVPIGVYRELLVDALAKTVGMSSERLSNALGLQRAGGSSAPNQVQADRAERETSVSSSTPRSRLVRHAIHLLVHFPAIAQKVPNPDALAGLDKPGVPLLMELLHELHDDPVQTTGMLLERWRNRSEHTALAKLAVMECLVPTQDGAAQELRAVVERLVQERVEIRRDELLRKAQELGLNEQEKAELQELLRGSTVGAFSVRGRT
ncbi:MAG: DNA primase [Steroidobacteraceae bacterium]